MSQPARTLRAPAPRQEPRPARRPAPRPAPARRWVPAARPAPARRAAAARGARRSRAAAFLVLSSFVMGATILVLVALSALLAQSSFRVDDLENRIGALSQQKVELMRQQAALSAPGRIAVWARSHGMRLPDDVRYLYVPAAGAAAPAGDADSLAKGGT